MMTPSAYQRKILSIPEKYNLLLCGGRGGGKALDLDTPIPVPSGWKKLRDICVGDKVFDEHGLPCTVTAVFDRMPEKAYRLHFSDGTSLDACDEHQWVTWTHAERKAFLRHDKSPARGLPEDWAAVPSRTTQQIVDTLTFGKRGDNNHCIPTTGPLQLAEAKLPIDPYLLGVWLGDGTSRNGDITTMDLEVVAAFTDAGFSLRSKNVKGRATTYSVAVLPSSKGLPRGSSRSEWNQSLRDAGLIQNKHVPNVYLRASAAQRLALLQGLMDSDGHAASDKLRVEFCNTNKRLIDAVVELARSLGEKPTVAAGRAKVNGKDCGDKWRVTWRAKNPCFRIFRKLCRISLPRTQASRHTHRMIVGAEVIPVVPMRCLTVDSPNHMYLAGEGMIPTHNSVVLMMLLLRHVLMYGDRAYPLFVRESYEAIKQFEEEFELMVDYVYGRSASHNKTDHTFYFPNGAKIQLGQIAEQKDYIKYQGKSYTMLIVDEFGAIVNTKWVMMLTSNLRGAIGIPIRIVWAANPGGAQHGFLHHSFIAPSVAWKPYERQGEHWVICPSTWRDNPNIDQADYLKRLRMACGNDEELFKAWDTGDWNIARGAYFGGVLDERIHKLSEERFPIRLLTKNWSPYIAMDWGSGAPAVVYVMAESPGINGFPKGSLILCDELATYDPSDEGLNTGLDWPPRKLAEGIKDLCKPWGCPPDGVADDAYGLEDTLIERLEDCDIYVQKPTKDRISGWTTMRNMLADAKLRNGKPGLWIHQRCEYFWKTVPFLQRDPKRPEDIISKDVPDHGADAARYGCMHQGRGATSGGVTGNY